MSEQSNHSLLDDAITCVDLYGQPRRVPAAELLRQTAVYGILIEQQKVLLQTHPATHLLHPPGGPLTRLQLPAEALREGFRASTGLTPEPGSLLHIEDLCIFGNEANRGMLVTQLFYLVSRPRESGRGFIDFDNPSQPQWFPLDQLRRQQCQFGFNALQIAARHHQALP